MAALEGIDLSDYAKTTDLDEYAKKVSPALSGTPTAPTAAKTVNNTQIATTAFVHLLAGAANNGGIVDSLLAQNGYVKFANGLILQWGYSPGGGGITLTFPVSFSQCFSILQGFYSTGSINNWNWAINSYNNKEFSLLGKPGNGTFWLALGK